MRNSTTAALVAILGVAVLGCEVEEQEPGPLPAAEEERPMDPADTADDDPAMTIGVATFEDGGEYITDADGRALYAIEGEPEDRSTCYDECAEEWPPLLVGNDQPAAGHGSVRADLVGTLERQDGERQVTYAGRALYYYHDDQGPGQTEGQHVMDEWGEWYLIQPSGDLLEDDEGGEHEDGEGTDGEGPDGEGADSV